MTTYTRLYANNAKTTLASPISYSDTSIIVTDASLFPVPGTNQYFMATIDAGAALEILEVHGITGNVLTGCVRGQEGTTAQSFLTGTRIENRVTAGSLSAMARLIDRVADIASVDLLATPANSAGNSYLCASGDDTGTPILAVKKGVLWRFVSHPTINLSTTALAVGTTTTIPLTNASNFAPVTTPGSHIIQFTSGNNAGLARTIQSASTTTLVWAGSLPYAVAVSDAYQIYESSAYSINSVKSVGDDALIFSILFGD